MNVSDSLSHIIPTTLVLNQPQFLQAVRSVILDPGRMAIGHVRRRRTNLSRELIIDHWSTSDAFPVGSNLPPLLDWAVMTVNADGTEPARSLIDRIHPRKSHLLVAIALDSVHHDRLPVLIADQATLIRPEQIRFIGPGLLVLPEQLSRIPLTKNDERADEDVKSRTDAASPRSSRTIGALGDLYDRLGSFSVILVGAGRGGQELARQLVATGLRRLTIIDPDVIGPENLDAMPLAAAGDVGQSKAIQLAQSLHQNQPELMVSCLTKSMTSADAVRLVRETRADTIFSFVDSPIARLAVSRLCQETETVHVDVGTLVERSAEEGRTMSADVRLLEPHQGCIACVPQLQNLDDVLYELTAPSGFLHRGTPTVWHEERAGSLLHLNAFTASLAVETWLGWLSQSIVGSYWLRARWRAGTVPEIQSSIVGAARDCRFCNSAS